MKSIAETVRMVEEFKGLQRLLGMIKRMGPYIHVLLKLNRIKKIYFNTKIKLLEMVLRRIEVENFKSFDKLIVDLNKINILIGENASGKSNFIEIFRFIKDIGKFGLDNAISLHGGNKYIRNTATKESREMSFKFFYDISIKTGKRVIKKDILIKGNSLVYEFSIKFLKNDYKISKENVKIKFNLIKFSKGKRKYKIKQENRIGSGSLEFSRNKGILNKEVNLNIRKEDYKNKVNNNDIFPTFFIKYLENEEKHNNKIRKEIFLTSPLSFFPFNWSNVFSEISIYDFDPKMAKMAIEFSAKKELEENGSNLSLVIKKIKEDKKNEIKFQKIINNMLPFVEKCDVQQLSDRYWLFKLKEKFSKDCYPASLLSDGTINIIGLIIVLYFEESDISIIEEPERNMHPTLIQKVLEMIKDASKNKQIIITTHNPEVVKYANINDIYLIKRDENGYSKIIKPVDKEEVRIFLKNNLGLEDLFINNILGKL